MKIVLGSGSPRRQELLKDLGYDFRILVPNIEETINKRWPIHKVAENLAQLKANFLLPKINNDEVLICADTIVILDSQIIGKPSNEKESRSMLMKLSGREHLVTTGVAILNNELNLVFSETTEVSMKKLNEKEINFYIRNYKPYDKAGSYGIQEWIGLIGVSTIIGSYTNVIGLPTSRLHSELKRF